MYLDNIKIKKYRFALTKFRLSSHQLEIETGKGKQPVKIPISDCKCKLCNTIEDEFHFLLECPSTLFHLQTHFDAKAADDV